MAKLFQIVITASHGSMGSISSQLGEMFMNHIRGKSFITYHYRWYPCEMPGIESVKIGNVISFFFHVLWTRLTDAHAMASWYDTYKLIRLLKKEKPDIVHIHNIHGYFLNYKILLKYLQKNDVPIVWTLHDCWNFTGHCAHFQVMGCDEWRSGCHVCRFKNVYPSTIGMSRSEKNYAEKKEIFDNLKNITFVGVSDWMTQMARESFLGIHDIRRIYNGIDLNIFRASTTASEFRLKLGLVGKFIILGVATGWSDDKGLQEYKALSERLNGHYQIILIGIHPKIAKTLPDNIICIKQTGNQLELVEYYTMADVVTNLSTQESFGLTPVEGMACGTPAIVYNNTAQPELMDSDTGFVVETRNVDEVIAAIKTIEQNGKSFYSKACRTRVECLFDRNKTYMQYIELYKKLLKWKK